MSEELSALRARIEHVDASLVALIAERQLLARAVGMHKRSCGLPVIDPAREAAVITRAGMLARDVGLPEDDMRALFRQLVALSRRAQSATDPAAVPRCSGTEPDGRDPAA